MKFTPAMVSAAEIVLRGYISDPKISAAGAFLEAYEAFLDAGTKKARQKREGEPEGFDGFYSAFPRRIGRRAAAKAYGSALKRSTQEIILAGCKRYAESVKGTEQQYIKHPATWLNADGWKDELGRLTLAAVAFEETNLPGWLKRLEIFSGKTDSPRGTWRASWGPKPNESGTKVPKAAIDEYYRLYPKKTG
jgi:hypothetical protein